MNNDKRITELNETLNELVKVTFEREALLGEWGRLELYLNGDTEEQKSLKEKALQILTDGKELQTGMELQITNYGFITLYKILKQDESSKQMQKVHEFPRPKNWNLLPYGFVMGRKCTKTTRDNILNQMK